MSAQAACSFCGIPAAHADAIFSAPTGAHICDACSLRAIEALVMRRHAGDATVHVGPEELGVIPPDLAWKHRVVASRFRSEPLVLLTEPLAMHSESDIAELRAAAGVSQLTIQSAGSSVVIQNTLNKYYASGRPNASDASQLVQSCSFCGLDRSQVALLQATSSTAVCDQCVDLLSDMLWDRFRRLIPGSLNLDIDQKTQSYLPHYLAHYHRAIPLALLRGGSFLVLSGFHVPRIDGLLGTLRDGVKSGSVFFVKAPNQEVVDTALKTYYGC